MLFIEASAHRLQGWAVASMIGCLRVLKIAAQKLDQSHFVRLTTWPMNQQKYMGIIGTMRKAIEPNMM